MCAKYDYAIELTKLLVEKIIEDGYTKEKAEEKLNKLLKDEELGNAINEEIYRRSARFVYSILGK